MKRVSLVIVTIILFFICSAYVQVAKHMPGAGMEEILSYIYTNEGSEFFWASGIGLVVCGVLIYQMLTYKD